MKVEWYHLFILALLLVSGIICNTSDKENALLSGKKSEWNFLDGKCKILARKIAPINNDMIYKNIEISTNGTQIVNNKQLMMTTYFGLLPIVRNIDQNQIEILLGIKAPEIDKIHRFIISAENEIIKSDTIPLLRGDHSDIDADKLVEFSGFMNDFPPYCSNCDSVFYNPVQYYEMHSSGFRFDSLATKNWIDKHYQSFHGFAPNKAIVVKEKRKTIGI